MNGEAFYGWPWWVIVLFVVGDVVFIILGIRWLWRDFWKHERERSVRGLA